ncbi:MAG: hypothetical protein JWP97_2209 [Labilithrix sp.]|nr:hypothetical protein [Labilithrix sp.]
MNWTKRAGKWLFASAVVGATCVSVGCLSRPVGTQSPTTKVNFTSTVSQQAVDKVDLLFAIDNSGSMGDKQQILSEAVPALLTGLLNPNCVDSEGKSVGKTADPNGNEGNKFGCPAGSTPEFTPVTDMHIGIVSSSLGGFGGDQCAVTGAGTTPRNNDKAHLISLGKDGLTQLPDASTGFLAWFPTNTANADAKRHPKPAKPVTDFTALQDDFQNLVLGTGQNGCGLEAQLESFYRFLVQPDPWTQVTVQNGVATLGAANDIDTTVLQQRADFLRPDSLVAIIMLTDEDDSSADPLTVGGQGYNFMSSHFPGGNARADGTTTAPRGTSVCATNPGDPNCTSCGFAADCKPVDSAACQLLKNDPNCQKDKGYYAGDEESLNVRFHRMKERFGVDPQYPIQRYVDGLTKFRVPDRSTEHVVNGNAIGPYLGAGKCTNPLFAKNLPRAAGAEICQLERSTRTPDLIFFAVVGGVPNGLLHFDPNDPEKSRVKGDDWNAILGKDPAHFNYEGIDPHMIQSIVPRPGIPGPSATKGDNGSKTDPVGRDWDTANEDLQYACTFDLPTPKTGCTVNSGNCDCPSDKPGVNPPLCGPTAGTQVKAKAYPTVREFMVVRALGDQGIISSLCPISLTVPKTDPTYGYNPAVKSIIDRLKNALTTQCLPQKLTRETNTTNPDDKNKVPCLVLAQLGEVTDSCAAQGLQEPAKEILSKFRDAQKAASGNVADGGTDLSQYPVCELPQLVVEAGETCAGDNAKGWCYVENGPSGNPAGRCPQALIFSAATSALQGAQFSLQCINQFSQEAGTP